MTINGDYIEVCFKSNPNLNWIILYRAYEVTDTNVKIKPVTEPDGEARCVSLQKVLRCKVPAD